MDLNNRKKFIYIALLTTLQIILGHFAGIKTPIFSISLGFLPLATTAALFGAVQAALSATAADVISFLLFPTGIFFPGFTLSAAMAGMIYGQFFYKKAVSLGRVVAACLTVSIFISLLLNTFWLYLLTEQAITVLLPVRILQNTIMLPLKIYMIWMLFKRLYEKKLLYKYV